MHSTLTPAELSEQLASSFVDKSCPKSRKVQGQFFTPLPLARFMADLAEYRKSTLRVLDAGGGSGTLSCAVCEAAARRKTVKRIEIDTYEDSPSLAGSLRQSLAFSKQWLAKRGIELTYNVIEKDFILSVPQGLWASQVVPYDLAIGNPPYFKIGKDDPRAKAAARFVHGQPNIYALFMGMAAEVLGDKGLMVFITPRSYASGPYFELFRKRFFGMMQPERVHLFESRMDAFKKDEVLQENIILKARKAGNASRLRISVSPGIDSLSRAASYHLAASKVLYSKGRDMVFRLPASHRDIELIDIVEQWTGRLHRYGLQISTGPVVPFRATDLILNDKQMNNDIAPLLWMQNVHSMKVQWPNFHMKNSREKPQFIKANRKALRKRLLIADQNVVLLRRFSAKEDSRRLIAAPLLRGQLDARLIGLENHLNYIYRPTGELTKPQAMGLSALLNSSLLDRYFRISNGNTQVSATEIRAMPLPPLQVIEQMGQIVRQLNRIPEREEIDDLVWDMVQSS
jgi:adenine-specific DNA-methyltransferase